MDLMLEVQSGLSAAKGDAAIKEGGGHRQGHGGRGGGGGGDTVCMRMRGGQGDMDGG